MKRSGDVRKSAQAALAAAERTFQRCWPLPFETTAAGDPLHPGRQRLKDAFLIDVARIRPDPKQPRREFDDGEFKELTASVNARVSWHVLPQSRTVCQPRKIVASADPAILFPARQTGLDNRGRRVGLRRRRTRRRNVPCRDRT